MKREGRIISLTGGLYTVISDGVKYECRARGKFRNINISPVPGDICTFENGVIEKTGERRSLLLRPPVANADILCIVVSTTLPVPNYKVIDSVAAEAQIQNIEPIFVITKQDLKCDSKISEIYKKCGFCVFVSDFENKTVPEGFVEKIAGKFTVFTGNSGVGKSTFLNMLVPELSLETNEVSKKLNRGKHTTRMINLFEYMGGFIADTPGFSSFDITLCNNISSKTLFYAFREFWPYEGRCRFNDCTHRMESGCALREAVERGDIPKSRYESYLEIYKKLDEIKPWMKK